MTEIEFFEKINKHKQWCKNLAEGKGTFNIRRGQAKVSSGYIEDLFALYLAEKIQDHSLEFLVDKVTSLRIFEGEKAIMFKPDVSIINSENILTDYFDVKTNLGWNRNIENYIREKNKFIDSIKDRKGWIRFSKDEVKRIIFSPDLKYKMVVVDGGNINPEQLNENIKIANELENIELYILNDCNKVINIEDFNRLYNFK